MMTDQSDVIPNPLPSVSLLMRWCNGGDHVSKSIDSKRLQNLIDFWLIVVGDGSIYDMASLIATYSHDPRLYVVHHAKNQVPISGLNAQLQACGSGLVAQLDANDTDTPTRLQHQIAILTRPPGVVLYATAQERFLPLG